MGIRESRTDRQMNVVAASLSSAGGAVSFSSRYMDLPDVDGQEQDGESISGEAIEYNLKKGLTKKEYRRWKRMTKRKQEGMIQSGLRQCIRHRRQHQKKNAWMSRIESSRQKESRSEANDEAMQDRKMSTDASGDAALPGDPTDRTRAASDAGYVNRVTDHLMKKRRKEILRGGGASGSPMEDSGRGGGYPVARAGRSTTKELTRRVKQMLQAEQESDDKTISNTMAYMRRIKLASQLTIRMTRMFIRLIQLMVTMFQSLMLVLLPVILIVALIVGLLAAILGGSASQSTPATGEGLPPFVTEEMMEAFFLTQKESGIPVSTGIAQLIQESGFCMYGPGGDRGVGLSLLAANYNNLFGIKHVPGDTNASGSVNMMTGEQTASGESYTINDGFSVYATVGACIKQRAEILHYSLYSVHLANLYNPGDGSYTKEQADQFVWGIKAGGWASDVSYVQLCIGHMEKYNLYRFDNMTYEDYKKAGASSTANMTYNGVITDKMKSIVEVARNNTGLYECSPDYCALWVDGVYQAAGVGDVKGHAIGIWNDNQSCASTSMDNIPPGAIVCGSGVGPMGASFGHVGIYLGDGTVANNVGHFSIEPLSDWISWQTANCQGHVGWIGWVAPRNILDP